MEPVRTGFSTYIFEGDGVTNVFPLQFTLGELKRSYVTCQVADEVDGLGNPVYRELIEVPGDPSMIQIGGSIPAVGDKIEFKRVVPKDLLLHLYANGSILDYPSLDESHLQLMMALHEVLDGAGLKNVYTDINMHGYKLTNIYSDPDDPDSIATVAFLGTYRQDALDAAVAAANSAIQALGYKNAAANSAIESMGYRNTALYHANTAAAQVALCQDQVQLAANQVLIAQAAQLAAEAISTEAAARAYNYIINGNFDIWQRGTSQTTSGYGSVDRWTNNHTGTTKVASRQSFTVGQTGVPNNPKYFLRNVVTSVVGASNNCVVAHKIEGVATLSGKKATLSFYAQANAVRSMAVEMCQVFGTGGSPSADVLGIGITKVSLSTAWQKFTILVDIPSIAGKVLGTDGNDHLRLNFWFDAGSSFNARTDSLGHQSGTFDIACVSLVEGDVDVKPIPRSIGEELALCQRYYQIGYARISAYTSSGSNLSTSTTLRAIMRATPTLSASWSTSNITGTPAIYYYDHGIAIDGVSSTTGYTRVVAAPWIADAEL